MAQFIPRRLRDLVDVSAASPSEGDVLSFSGGAWTGTQPSSGPTAPTQDEKQYLAAQVRKRELWSTAYPPVADVLDDNGSRQIMTAAQPVTNGTMRQNGYLLAPAGATVTRIGVFCGSVPTAGNSTHLWFALVNLANGVVRKTLDDTNANPATAGNWKILSLDSPWTPSVDTPVRVGIVSTVSAGSPFGGLVAVATSGVAPLMACNSTTGLTDPASLGATAVLGANANCAWCVLLQN